VQVKSPAVVWMTAVGSALEDEGAAGLGAGFGAGVVWAHEIRENNNSVLIKASLRIG
jgi:hypothetical protein